MSNDDYEAIDCVLLKTTASAILIDVNDEEIWIPASLVHHEDFKQAKAGDRGEDISLRVRAWKVKELGLG